MDEKQDMIISDLFIGCLYADVLVIWFVFVLPDWGGLFGDGITSFVEENRSMSNKTLKNISLLFPCWMKW